ncbi:hypothetical protein H4R19_006463 [Coemansia spiralis]|nr:hypothetical protein H4R19_006463 [Coemansia spiralis]
MEVRGPQKATEDTPPATPDPNREMWEARPVKRYKSSPAWIDDEKAVVAEALSTGRKSVAELVRRLGGSKSLRQVAEYVERLELWSRVLGPPESGAAPVPEAEEVVGWFVLDEERAAAAAAQHEDMEAAAHSGEANAAGIPRRYQRHDRLIDAECADLLAQIASRRADAGAARSVGAFVGQALEEFLRRVIHELAISSRLAGTGYGGLRLGRPVDDGDVEAALERCRLPATQPVQATFQAFVRRHLDPDLEPPTSPLPSDPSSGESSAAADSDSQRRAAGSGPGDRDPRGLGIGDQWR